MSEIIVTALIMTAVSVLSALVFVNFFIIKLV
ncbi:Uncharacterised protein [Serratia rubidaea]|uniref:Uncharacterized protein n=1 Tax=Serratia rubidaea TaxID=61652 RepID=A0A3S4WR83_SERRU|nr:Uncharacterised protein [Serratia rubidaea]CAI1852755.1 Uncharacterised protein [Serratia rubidaea]VEA73066.1 Uncharacterised protein [Serratia rubidaea]VEI71758.1 Uncharacterised protein [Serratia rubidaea]VTP61633.1 Uncharacterised protein [Serratia rubidaea]